MHPRSRTVKIVGTPGGRRGPGPRGWRWGAHLLGIVLLIVLPTASRVQASPVTPDVSGYAEASGPAAGAGTTGRTARVTYRLRRCGIVTLRGEVGPAPHRVTARGVTCRRARKIVIASSLGRPPRGWSCTGSGAESLCAPGSYNEMSQILNTPGFSRTTAGSGREALDTPRLQLAAPRTPGHVAPQ